MADSMNMVPEGLVVHAVTCRWEAILCDEYGSKWATGRIAFLFVMHCQTLMLVQWVSLMHVIAFLVFELET